MKYANNVNFAMRTLQGYIDELTTKITDLEDRVTELEDELETVSELNTDLLNELRDVKHD